MENCVDGEAEIDKLLMMHMAKHQLVEDDNLDSKRIRIPSSDNVMMISEMPSN